MIEEGKASGDLVEICLLPRGNRLYRQSNGVGGHTYYSDEVGGGVFVWDTTLVMPSTMLAAVLEDMKLYQESLGGTRSNAANETANANADA
jgi:hypothetical protein